MAMFFIDSSSSSEERQRRDVADSSSSEENAQRSKRDVPSESDSKPLEEQEGGRVKRSPQYGYRRWGGKCILCSVLFKPRMRAKCGVQTIYR